MVSNCKPPVEVLQLACGNSSMSWACWSCGWPVGYLCRSPFQRMDSLFAGVGWQPDFIADLFCIHGFAVKQAISVRLKKCLPSTSSYFLSPTIASSSLLVAHFRKNILQHAWVRLLQYSSLHLSLWLCCFWLVLSGGSFPWAHVLDLFPSIYLNIKKKMTKQMQVELS